MTDKIKEIWLSIFDFFAMYVFSLLGVTMSIYIPQFWAGEDIAFMISWTRFALACVISFMVMSGVELRGDTKGKRKPMAFVRRAISALTLGSFWYNMLGAVK